ncbi:MAG TPA: NYN domain-containing protein [Candidatus Saccharimonadales bacterium]|nr:NYN domain-containing protein [Candidatus Saccharimonadales bacterium]
MWMRRRKPEQQAQPSQPKVQPPAVASVSQETDRPRVYAFIDSQNLNIGTQRFGWKMNWVKFREWLAERYNVEKAYMFIGYLPENEDLYEKMHQAGYLVVLKPTFDVTRPRPEEEKGDEEAKPVKGNIDADLVLWAMKEIGNYQKAIIVSGDGDFYSLVEYLEHKGRLSHLLTPSGYYSQLYNPYEKYIVRLDHFRHELAYHDYRRRPGQGKGAAS